MKKITSTTILLLFVMFANSQVFQPRSTGFPINTSSSLLSVVNDDIIWAKSATNNYFSKSTDGGNTWLSVLSSGIPTTFSATDMAAISATTAFISGFDSAVGTNTGIFKTSNGGLNWTKVTTASFTASSFPDIIHFFDANNGVVIGDPDNATGQFEIYTTANAGLNWSRLTSANLPASVAGEYGITNKYDAVGPNMWFITAGPTRRLFKTQDFGLTWTASSLSSLNIGSSTYNISFADANKGMIVVNNGTASAVNLYATTNGGTTFTLFDTVLESPNGVDIEYIPGTTSLFLKLQTGTYFSTNDALTFNNVGTSGNLMTFLNFDTGFTTGNNTSATQGGVFKFINTISLIGSSIGTPWTTDLDMTTTDGKNYLLENVTLTAGAAKFRQNHTWSPASRDWGSLNFPSGIGLQNIGENSNIPVQSGTYDISFNIITGAYNFQNSLKVKEQSKTAISLYPNPTNSTLNIKFDREITAIRILDIFGRSVSVSDPSAKSVDVSSLRSGLYFVELSTAQGMFSEKFIKN